MAPAAAQKRSASPLHRAHLTALRHWDPPSFAGAQSKKKIQKACPPSPYWSWIRRRDSPGEGKPIAPHRTAIYRENLNPCMSGRHYHIGSPQLTGK
jgi:hypothetical protein